MREFIDVTGKTEDEAIAKAQYDILLSEIQGYKIDWDYGN